MQSITESRDKKLFMGRFGPWGLARISHQPCAADADMLAVIVFNEHLPGGGSITMKVVCTIALSVVNHGCSANPLVAAPVMLIKVPNK
jgi:hypothetical protein